MPRTITAEVCPRQARSGDRSAAERSREYDLWLSHLKQAMAATGWTIDALAAHLEIDRSYVSRMLDGEKPWSGERLVALPDDLEAKLNAIRAEHFGLIVVRPLTGLEAQKALVAGLIGVMSAPALPAKAGPPVKATLRDEPAKQIA